MLPSEIFSEPPIRQWHFGSNYETPWEGLDESNRKQNDTNLAANY
jgi:hypothetical protein